MARKRTIFILSLGTFVLAAAVGISGFFTKNAADTKSDNHGTTKSPIADPSTVTHNSVHSSTGKRASTANSAGTSAPPVGSQYQVQVNPKKLGTIVSLGDSITYGFNLPGANANGKHASPDAYPYVLGKMMHANVIDLGVPRWTTDNLIAALKTTPYQTALQQATLVTVDIGSNDLLHAFNNVLADYLQGKEPATLTPTVQSLQTNIAKLPNQLTTIIHLIRQNTQAPIALTTIYDPSPDKTAIHDFTNPYIVEANRVILNEAATEHTLLYDAYDTMNHQQWSLIRIMHFDIHPTIAGQKALAGGFYAMWQNEDWNQPTRYAVTTAGATIYQKPSTTSKVLGRIQGDFGYAIVSQMPKWDKISFNHSHGYVLRKNVNEITRYEASAQFGKETVLSLPIQWEMPNGTMTSGFMVHHRYYVPVSALAKMAGGVANWNNALRTVDLTVGDPSPALTRAQPHVVPQVNTQPSALAVEYMGIGIQINGELVHLTSDPFSYEGNIYVPVDPIWTQLGGQINPLNGRFTNNP